MQKEGLTFLNFMNVKEMKEHIKKNLKDEELYILAKLNMAKEMAEELAGIDEIKSFNFDVQQGENYT